MDRQDLGWPVSGGWRQRGDAAQKVNGEPLLADAEDHTMCDFVLDEWR
jgi:hypothetical protein